ncbi:MAG: PH domain-containing protein [Acidimicrobiaceae bacterium]|nr:PH domain-containing protein [Acidimicrobiaceae bacterium]
MRVPFPNPDPVRGGGPEEQWRRTHPLSPLGRGAWAVLIVMMVGVITTVRGRQPGTLPVLVASDLGLFAVIAVVGYLRWFFVNWRVLDGRFEMRTGIFRRLSTSVEFSRIQAVDLVRPVHLRPWKLCDVRLRVVGVSRSMHLAFVKEALAEGLRARLLEPPENPCRASAPSSVSAPTPTPGILDSTSSDSTSRPTQFVIRASARYFVVAGVLATITRIPFLLIVATALKVVLSPRSFFTHLAYSWVVPWALSEWTWWNQRLNLAVVEEGEKWVTTSGWAKSFRQSVPRSRIQALALRQAPLWRPFGWWSLDAVVAGLEEGSTKSSLRPLLSVGTWETTWSVVHLLIPGASPPQSPPPRRVRWKSPLRYHLLRSGVTSSLVSQRSGRLGQVIWLVPRAKVQSVSLVRGPWQHRWSLASLRLGVAGHSRGVLVRDREMDEAREWWNELALDPANVTSGPPSSPATSTDEKTADED